MNDKYLTTLLSIDGMTCIACEDTVRNAVKPLLKDQDDRILGTFVVRFAAGFAFLKHDPSLDPQRVINEIEKVGFVAKIVQSLLDVLGVHNFKDKVMWRRAFYQLLVLALPIVIADLVIYLRHIPVHDLHSSALFPKIYHVGAALLTTLSMIVAYPIFFKPAFGHLIASHLNMDVLITVSALLLYTASMLSFGVSLFSQSHVMMACFNMPSILLLVISFGRFQEARLKHNIVTDTIQLDHIPLPTTAKKYTLGQPDGEACSPKDIRYGDQLLVSPNDIIPVDGFITDIIGQPSKRTSKTPTTPNRRSHSTFFSTSSSNETPSRHNPDSNDRVAFRTPKTLTAPNSGMRSPASDGGDDNYAFLADQPSGSDGFPSTPNMRPPRALYRSPSSDREGSDSNQSDDGGDGGGGFPTTYPRSQSRHSHSDDFVEMDEMTFFGEPRGTCIFKGEKVYAGTRLKRSSRPFVMVAQCSLLESSISCLLMESAGGFKSDHSDSPWAQQLIAVFLPVVVLLSLITGVLWFLLLSDYYVTYDRVPAVLLDKSFHSMATHLSASGEVARSVLLPVDPPRSPLSTHTLSYLLSLVSSSYTLLSTSMNETVPNPLTSIPLTLSTRVFLSLKMGVGVLLIACPCALGMAPVMAKMVALSVARRLHITIKDMGALQRLLDARTVAFDKTGTLTRVAIGAFVSMSSSDEGNSTMNTAELLELVYQAENHPSVQNRPVAVAIREYVLGRDPTLPERLRQKEEERKAQEEALRVKRERFKEQRVSKIVNEEDRKSEAEEEKERRQEQLKREELRREEEELQWRQKQITVQAEATSVTVTRTGINGARTLVTVGMPVIYHSNKEVPEKLKEVVDGIEQREHFVASDYVEVCSLQSHDDSRKPLLEGYFVLVERPNVHALETVQRLKQRWHKDIVVVSGAQTTEQIGTLLGLPKERCWALHSSEDKGKRILSLKEEQQHLESGGVQPLKEGGVAMVGDGANDVSALRHADCGIAFGSKAPFASLTADVCVQRDDLWGVIELLELADALRRVVHRNYLWAMLYNVLSIPVAVGLLVPYGIYLPPGYCAAMMACSSLIVLLSSLMLKGFTASTPPVTASPLMAPLRRAVHLRAPTPLVTTEKGNNSSTSTAATVEATKGGSNGRGGPVVKATMASVLPPIEPSQQQGTFVAAPLKARLPREGHAKPVSVSHSEPTLADLLEPTLRPSRSAPSRGASPFVSAANSRRGSEEGVLPSNGPLVLQRSMTSGMQRQLQQQLQQLGPSALASRKASAKSSPRRNSVIHVLSPGASEKTAAADAADATMSPLERRRHLLSVKGKKHRRTSSVPLAPSIGKFSFHEPMSEGDDDHSPQSAASSSQSSSLMQLPPSRMLSKGSARRPLIPISEERKAPPLEFAQLLSPVNEGASSPSSPEQLMLQPLVIRLHDEHNKEVDSGNNSREETPASGDSRPVSPSELLPGNMSESTELP